MELNLLMINLFRFSRLLLWLIILFNFAFLLCSTVRAQAVIDTFNLPTGYSLGQLQNKNVLKVDPSNNVWVGFKQIGAGKFDGVNWTMFDTSNGLPSVNVLSFAFSGNTTWIGTTKGLVKYDGTFFSVYDSLNSGLTSNYIAGLLLNGNNLWIGTKAGALIFDGVNWTHYSTTNSGLPSDTVNCFAKSGNDTIWLGTANGLSKFVNGNWTTYNLSVSSPNESINKIVSDASGNIWIQTKLYPFSQQYIYYYILHNDLITSLNEFFSFCYPLSYGNLVGLNHLGKIVCLGSPFEISLYPLSSSVLSVNLPWLFFNSVADLDSYDRIWYIQFLISNPKLIAADYQSALQPFLPAGSCYNLDANQVSARIWNNGCLFWDLVGNAQYEVPKGSGKNSIFADGLWIGGLDASNKLHIAAQTYRQSGADFWPGPLDTINATIDSATNHNFDRVWKIDRLTIDEFINQFHSGNVTNASYIIPDIILQWPAQGSGNYSRRLAPFIDFNNDGVYNPYDGDYPDIKGDQMIWFVFNDSYRTHGETQGGVPLGVEVQCSAYEYNCPNISDSDEAINYTTFFDYKIFNRSDTSYSQVYISKYTDTDLGNYLDDRVGCDTILNIAYTYNGDNNDDGINGYGYNPPMQNILYLSDTMSHFTYYNGDFSVTGNPVSAKDFYYRMQSLWKDSSYVTYGGNGHGASQGATNVPTNYFFPGNPYDTINSSAWNEINAGYTADDRRFVTSVGSYNLPAHSERDFDIAYVWTRDAAHPNGLTTSWAKNVHDILKVKEWYSANNFPCYNRYVDTNSIATVDTFSFNLYPNPTKGNISVFLTDKNSDPYTMDILDMLGRKILSQSIIPNTKTTIYLEGLSSGVYFVRISNEENFAVKKFIKE
jgi:hypothetical protein